MNELVFKGQNDQVVTTSLKVAEVFQKEHRDVLESIRELIKGSAEFSATPMFEETTYVHPQNKQQYPMFLMNRDGFTLLAMGFTGDKALRFKMAYINAFNKMEQALRKMQPKLPSYAEALRQLADKVEENEKLQLENKQQQQIITEYEPKVTYHDLVLRTPDVLSVSQISKDYGKSAVWMNKKLEELGVQYKQGGVWLLYQKYAELGLTKSKTSVYRDPKGEEHSTLHTYWTQKGRLFIYDLLKQNGELPLIEKD